MAVLELVVVELAEIAVELGACCCAGGEGGGGGRRGGGVFGEDVGGEIG